MSVTSPFFNSVLPTKIYEIWGHKKLDEIQADSASAALKLARDKWGESARSAILKTSPPDRKEPMFA